MSINQINDGDSGLTVRTILNEMVSFINSDVNYIGTGSFAKTGSNTFIGNQTITGSVNITGSLTVNTVNVGQNTLNFIDNNGNIINSLLISGSNLILSTGSIMSSYKVYTALLSQSGSDNPTSIILENTLGNIIWSRTSAGTYDGTLIGAFPVSKSFCIIQKDTFISEPPQDENSIKRISNDTIRVLTGGGGLADGILDNTSVEIRVYN